MISYQKSGYFSPIINDYLDEKPSLNLWYNRFPSIENFEKQIEEKRQNYNEQNRKIIVSVLKNQYKNVEISNVTKQNIDSLLDSNTFTITTGHQLNLFTGPLYFLYKIVSTINLCKELKEKYPNKNFVPIYWMATEDHDFEEVNYFNLKDNKIIWKTNQSGAVGRFLLNDIDAVFNDFSEQIGTVKNAEELKTLFKNAYLEHQNVADATRFLANELFRKYGLVIIDGDDKELKRQFAPYIKEELLHQKSFEKVTETISKTAYKAQVNPREINLFYLNQHIRERIILKNEKYLINNTKIEFTASEILSEIEKNPENFSPNVILRPLYQEVILPNLCYIGGGGELAYWLQLKEMFASYKITFPMLLLRNSVLLTNQKQDEVLKKLNLSWNDLFMKQDALVNQYTKKISEFPIDFSVQKQHLQNQFLSLYEIATQTDKSFVGAVKAQEKKQINGLEKLEKRLLKAQKRKLENHLLRIINLQNELFPNQSLQERQLNFSEVYLEYGSNFIEQLLLKLKPLEQNFMILQL